jgi:hypothetical protein
VRYLDVDSVDFYDGSKTVKIKPRREYPEYQLTGVYRLRGEKTLDEVAFKIYGGRSQSLTYKLFDFNRVALKEYGYDLTKIKSLKIPK